MESMLKTKKQGLLIVLSGPSGCGKNTIINKVMENNKNIWLSISCTSREPRGEEKNGVNYYFLSREEFEQEIENDEFLEYARRNTFAVSGMVFQDAYDLDLERLMRCHICEVDPRHGMVPFCAYNLTDPEGLALYREP